MSTTLAWHLKSRPAGAPDVANFELRELALPELQDGWIRVENVWLSVDPYMRARMNDAKSYVPPFGIGEPLEGGAVGKVIESRSPRFHEGETVLHMAGWRGGVAGPAEMFTRVPPMPAEDHQWLGNLGMTGMSAYFGLLRVAQAKEGDILFVSAAAGAVGSTVVQIAKAKGMTVIASAGGAEKCAWLCALGADAAIDYKAQPILEGLKAAAPDGIDIYFDNVGGDHLDAAFAVARQNAIFAICGMIEAYNAPAPPCFNHIMRLITARITMKGFSHRDYAGETGDFYRDMGRWIADGNVVSRETVRDGIETAPQAFLDLFSGVNFGKMLVRL